MADSVHVAIDVTLWEEPQMEARGPWEWQVRANGRSTEGKCARRDEAIDRAMRQIEVEVRSARS